MTDWEEDDFGTFESAEATSSTGSVASSVTSITTTPAWLLVGPASQEKLEGFVDRKEEQQASVFVNEKVNTTFTEDQLKSSQNVFPADEMTKISAEQTTEAVSTNKWNAFADMSEAKPDIEKHGKDQENISKPLLLSDNHIFDDIFNSSSPQIASTMESTTIETVQNDPKPETKEIAKESDVVLELRNKLDTAMAIKEQTEKSLLELQNELSELMNGAKIQRERKEEEHKKELEKIKKEQENELSQLREDSQKMMKLLSEEYTSLAAVAAEKQKNDYAKNLEEITGKCLELMEQQNKVLSQKLTEEGVLHSNSVTEIIQKSKLDMEEFVKSECDATTKSCSSTKEETEALIKESLEKEFEKQREIDAESKKTAMEEMRDHFNSQLKESLRVEREKQSEALTVAMEEVRRRTREGIEHEQKINKISQDRHIMALQMLLTSSQEHLRHLSQTVSDQSEDRKTE